MKNKKIKLLLNFLNRDECEKIMSNSYDMDSLRDRILIEVEKYFVTNFKGFKLNGVDDLKLNQYVVGQKYNDFESTDENYVSFLIQLNDDYSEGYFQFLVDDGNNYFQAHHGLGHLVLFFSNLSKRTTPVTNGIKHTLTGTISLIETYNSNKTLI